MVDRNARDQISAIIRAYMAEEIMAFELDEKTSKIMESTQDKTVRQIWFLLYGYFDDIKNHKVVANREIWQHLHRMLLVLESNGEYHVAQSRWCWNGDQWFALVCLALYVCVLFILRNVDQFSLVCIQNVLLIPFVIWIFKRREARALERLELKRRVMPFSSFRNLLYWRRRVQQFEKILLTSQIEKREIRSLFCSSVWTWLSTAFFCLFFSPIIMLCFCFPQRDTLITIIDCHADGHAPA